MTDAKPNAEEGEWRVKDLRCNIVTRKLGRRQDYESPLSKEVLNSMHRYLTGEFYYPPKAYRTAASPPVDELRHELCIILANEGYETFEEIVAPNGGGDPPDSMVPPARSDAHSETRPFRKNELDVIRQALIDAEDLRPPGDDT